MSNKKNLFDTTFGFEKWELFNFNVIFFLIREKIDLILFLNLLNVEYASKIAQTLFGVKISVTSETVLPAKVKPL